MHARAVGVITAFHEQELTALEFAELIRFLPPEEAAVAIIAVSSLWLHDMTNEPRRLQARQICRRLRMSLLSLN